MIIVSTLVSDLLKNHPSWIGYPSTSAIPWTGLWGKFSKCRFFNVFNPVSVNPRIANVRAFLTFLTFLTLLTFITRAQLSDRMTKEKWGNQAPIKIRCLAITFLRHFNDFSF